MCCDDQLKPQAILRRSCHFSYANKSGYLN